MGIVTEYTRNLIFKQVYYKGRMVWYDPDGGYCEAAEALDLPNTTVLRFEGSFVHLRCEIDQKRLIDGEEPPHLVIYVPMAQDHTQYLDSMYDCSSINKQFQEKDLVKWRLSSYSSHKTCKFS